MQHANLPENLERLSPHDELKFVIADRRDFDWALALVAERNLDRKQHRDVLSGLGGAAGGRPRRPGCAIPAGRSASACSCTSSSGETSRDDDAPMGVILSAAKDPGLDRTGVRRAVILFPEASTRRPASSSRAPKASKSTRSPSTTVSVTRSSSNAPGRSPPATAPPRTASSGSTFRRAAALGADRPVDPGARATRSARSRSRSRTFRRATRSSSRTRWPGANRSAPSTSSSARTPSTTRAIPTAGPSFSSPSRRTANLGTRAGVEGAAFRIHAPLLRMGKAEIVRQRRGARPRFRIDLVLLRPRARTAPPAARATPVFFARRASRKPGSRIRSGLSS